jgi:voltage-gated potassium channel
MAHGMKKPDDDPDKQLTAWDLVLAGISIVVVIMLIMEMAVDFEPDTQKMLNRIDFVLCFLFLGDFAWRLWSAPNRLAYMKWGWLDLISSLPAHDYYRWGRLFRLIRVLRAIRSARHILHVMKQSRRRTFFLGALFTAFFILEFGSLAVLHFEEDAEKGNIKTPQQAFWWSLVTVSTVGYGDHYPVTTGGRVCAGVLMITGAGFFSSLAAVLASWLLRPHEEPAAAEEEEEDTLRNDITALRGEIAALRAALEQGSAGKNTL